ncbi:uncharacterized protein MONOS_16117 [Monocercomonoides exilis]|uniref:uncharacterized protein n=1 Tax=Monocercomonoides exilis TaxID=2049356 RepID=UPI00355A2ADB|nr:hypothetical protein MONOS_16117 [Monocercomonoides exilis]|eukprot:MONOS_16117.1-p1 / transcript=MONOS_16117.1 / gene=MONOS_16117 / organism=Monocercomonoides_exilis_PA203 / gene_product=unspecified product / transcript_product=unspecified product / location=Mono_scaffold01513:3247-3856(-) / protein_length=173 / sequence_SO=supercontig / SO=protein_coding / is_pseudo=false
MDRCMKVREEKEEDWEEKDHEEDDDLKGKPEEEDMEKKQTAVDGRDDVGDEGEGENGGERGNTGYTGDTGDMGDIGCIGDTGDTGDASDTGEAEEDGEGERGWVDVLAALVGSESASRWCNASGREPNAPSPAFVDVVEPNGRHAEATYTLCVVVFVVLPADDTLAADAMSA